MSTKVGFELVKNLAIETPTKIIMVVSDGLGGFAHPDTGKTELETCNDSCTHCYRLQEKRSPA